MTDFDPARHRMVSEQRWFEDFVLGERFVIPSRTQTSAVFAAFQTASGDTHPIHYDVEYCRARGMPHLLAHGFQTLTDDSELLYLISEFYYPESARGVAWDDPAFGIAWPIPVTLSATDEQASTLREGDDVALCQAEHLLGVLHLAERARALATG